MCNSYRAGHWTLCIDLPVTAFVEADAAEEVAGFCFTSRRGFFAVKSRRGWPFLRRRRVFCLSPSMRLRCGTLHYLCLETGRAPCDKCGHLSVGIGRCDAECLIAVVWISAPYRLLPLCFSAFCPEGPVQTHPHSYLSEWCFRVRTWLNPTRRHRHRKSVRQRRFLRQDSFNTWFAHFLNKVAFLLLTRYPTERMASRL